MDTRILKASKTCCVRLAMNKKLRLTRKRKRKDDNFQTWVRQHFESQNEICLKVAYDKYSEFFGVKHTENILVTNCTNCSQRW